MAPALCGPTVRLPRDVTAAILPPPAPIAWVRSASSMTSSDPWKVPPAMDERSGIEGFSGSRAGGAAAGLEDGSGNGRDTGAGPGRWAWARAPGGAAGPDGAVSAHGPSGLADAAVA